MSTQQQVNAAKAAYDAQNRQAQNLQRAADDAQRRADEAQKKADQAFNLYTKLVDELIS